jgi:ribosomal protein L32
VNIQEHGLFEEPETMNRSLHIKLLEDFIMCPECGYKQLREKACVKCGYWF